MSALIMFILFIDFTIKSMKATYWTFTPADLDFCLFTVSVFHTNFDEKFKEAKKICAGHKFFVNFKLWFNSVTKQGTFCPCCVLQMLFFIFCHLFFFSFYLKIERGVKCYSFSIVIFCCSF